MPTPRRYANRAEQQAAYRQRVRQARTQELLRKGLPPLPSVPSMPGKRRWDAAASQALLLLETIRDEMQDYYDERSEEWQDAQRGDEFSERLDTIDDVVSTVEGITQ